MSKKNRGKKSAQPDKSGGNSANTNDNSAAFVAKSDAKKKQSPYVYQRDKITIDLHIAERDDLTEKQKQLIDLILNRDTKMVFISGAAGTSKTFLAVLAGLMLLNKHSVSDIIYVRTIIESASKSLGSLPGEKELKMEPFVCPLLDKLDELLPANEIKALMNDGRIEGMPINYLRGSSYNAKYILLDEGQNASYEEIVTTITRLGKFSKMIIAGDPGQADIGVKSGFQRMYQLFDDEKCRENGIYCFSFGPEDIVRSGTLRFIIERLEYDRKLKLGLIDIDGTPRAEPMFPPV